MIYDCDGNVQAASGSLNAQTVSSSSEPSAGVLSGISPDVTLLLSPPNDDSKVEAQSALARWLATEIKEAKVSGPRCSQASLENDGKSFSVRFQTLTGAAGPFGYALQLEQPASDAPAQFAAGQSAHETSEGSTLITRQQWHDIKNELGGLKLYATFLRKRNWSSEDLEVVDKLLNGINGLIDHLARIRRGETR